MSDKQMYSAQTDILGAASALDTNKVLRNTYMLLGMTLAFSAVTAGVSMAVGLSQMAALVLMLVGFGLLFVVNKMADTAKGLPAIFAFTGVMGAALGPTLNYYLALPSGPSMIMQALGGTAIVFFGLSAYALNTRKDIFLGIPALSLTISAAIVMIMSGLILFDTSRIINGGETNYIRATVSLYLNIYNLFINILHLIGAFGGGDD